ncbi:MAG TPA: transposase [Dehalococcoidia bacterium]|nr:transposase [Dehalococcoidia bacterium]
MPEGLMRFPGVWYQVHSETARRFAVLRPSQQKGLALWVYGAILAGSATQTAVVASLLVWWKLDAIRQYLREWLYDGKDKAAACMTEVDVQLCFAPLMRWVMSLWKGEQLALAVDATLKQDCVTALVVSVLYRGTAIPVAWCILPANKKGPWLEPLLTLLRYLAPAVPPGMTVLVLSDRGLWSPRLWQGIRGLGWHPLMRVQGEATFQPQGGTRLAARFLAPGPGYAWVGQGVAFCPPKARAGTLLVVWGHDQAEPWLVLTDLPPDNAGVSWYGLRVWVELGFRALKGVGWRWEHTRRTDPDRVARHWLVLAVATLWVLAEGTRAEDAEVRGVLPARLLHPPPLLPPRPRRLSIFRRGLAWAQYHLRSSHLWRRLWLVPELWPEPAPHLVITYHAPPCLKAAAI